MDLGGWSLSVWRSADAVAPGGPAVALVAIAAGIAVLRVSARATIRRAAPADAVPEATERFVTAALAATAWVLASGVYVGFLFGLVLAEPAADLPWLGAPLVGAPRAVALLAAGAAPWAVWQERTSADRGAARRSRWLAAAGELALALGLPVAVTVARGIGWGVEILFRSRGEPGASGAS